MPQLISQSGALNTSPGAIGSRPMHYVLPLGELLPYVLSASPFTSATRLRKPGTKVLPLPPTTNA
jgi:hypothetical protein